MPKTLVLNVDDYGPARYARTKILQQAGFGVEEAGTGTETLRLLTHKPDIVLLDINLPDMDGLEVCRRIKSDAATAGIIVMHLSASSIRDTDRVVGLDNGADCYLTESIDSAVLISTIRALLRAREAEEALRRANQELRELTYLLSHDIREPLRAITIYTELLHDRLVDRITDEERQFIDHALTGARRLKALIEGVLELSRTAKGELEKSDVSVQDVVNGTLTELELLIREAGAAVTVGPMPRVWANATGVARVFANLLSNSLRYRSKEPLKISVNAECTGEKCTFEVRDNGVGINSAYHETIFEPFKRLHGQDVSGVGLGLFLCRKIVHAHGGEIWVESTPNQGTAFFFTLPVEHNQKRILPQTDAARQ